MLAAARVQLVQAEVAMFSMNPLHVMFEGAKEYMESYGYYPFGLSDQKREFWFDSPVLRRSDVVFFSSAVDERARCNAGQGLRQAQAAALQGERFRKVACGLT